MCLGSNTYNFKRKRYIIFLYWYFVQPPLKLSLAIYFWRKCQKGAVHSMRWQQNLLISFFIQFLWIHPFTLQLTFSLSILPLQFLPFSPSHCVFPPSLFSFLSQPSSSVLPFTFPIKKPPSLFPFFPLLFFLLGSSLLSPSTSTHSIYLCLPLSHSFPPSPSLSLSLSPLTPSPSLSLSLLTSSQSALTRCSRKITSPLFRFNSALPLPRKSNIAWDTHANTHTHTKGNHTHTHTHIQVSEWREEGERRETDTLNTKREETVRADR